MIKLLSGIITIFGVVLLGIQILCLLCAVEFVLKGICYIGESIGISNPLFAQETLDYWIVKSLVVLVCLFAIFGLLVMLTICLC